MSRQNTCELNLIELLREIINFKKVGKKTFLNVSNINLKT